MGPSFSAAHSQVKCSNSTANLRGLRLRPLSKVSSAIHCIACPVSHRFGAGTSSRARTDRDLSGGAWRRRSRNQLCNDVRSCTVHWHRRPTHPPSQYPSSGCAGTFLASIVASPVAAGAGQRGAPKAGASRLCAGGTIASRRVRVLSAIPAQIHGLVGTK